MCECVCVCVRARVRVATCARPPFPEAVCVARHLGVSIPASHGPTPSQPGPWAGSRVPCPPPCGPTLPWVGDSPRSPIADFPQGILSCLRQSSISTVPETTLSPSCKRRRYCAPSPPSSMAVRSPSPRGRCGTGERCDGRSPGPGTLSRPLTVGSGFCCQLAGGCGTLGSACRDPPGAAWGRGAGKHRAQGLRGLKGKAGGRG